MPDAAFYLYMALPFTYNWGLGIILLATLYSFQISATLVAVTPEEQRRDCYAGSPLQFSDVCFGAVISPPSVEGPVIPQMNDFQQIFQKLMNPQVPPFSYSEIYWPKMMSSQPFWVPSNPSQNPLATPLLVPPPGSSP